MKITIDIDEETYNLFDQIRARTSADRFDTLEGYLGYFLRMTTQAAAHIVMGLQPWQASPEDQE